MTQRTLTDEQGRPMDGDRTTPSDGLDVHDEWQLDADNGRVLPDDVARETLPREALVDMAKRDDPGAVTVDAADGPRLIAGGKDPSSVKSLIQRAMDRLNGGAPGSNRSNEGQRPSTS